jgi:hypothetical protein
VVSLAEALARPLLIEAVLTSWVVPAAIGLSTATTNVALPLAPPARLPTLSVQVLPASAPLAQLQPALLMDEWKVVLPGTFSVIVTPVRWRLPVFS